MQVNTANIPARTRAESQISVWRLILIFGRENDNTYWTSSKN